jgi:hypothetical protein
MLRQAGRHTDPAKLAIPGVSRAKNLEILKMGMCREKVSQPCNVVRDSVERLGFIGQYGKSTIDSTSNKCTSYSFLD